MAVNSFNAQNPPVNTKGDLFTFSTIPTKLGVGSNNQVLTADSTTATGLKWATASSGSLTQLSQVVASASSSISFTSISSSYKDLIITFEDTVSAGAALRYMGVRVNGSSSAIYTHGGYLVENSASITYIGAYAATSLTYLGVIPRTGSAQVRKGTGFMIFKNYTSALNKTVSCFSACGDNASFNSSQTNGTIQTSSAISSIEISDYNNSNTISGTFTLWGVN